MIKCRPTYTVQTVSARAEATDGILVACSYNVSKFGCCVLVIFLKPETLEYTYTYNDQKYAKYQLVETMMSRREKLLIRPWQQRKYENHRRKVSNYLLTYLFYTQKYCTYPL